jgi:hypothetical protein
MQRTREPQLRKTPVQFFRLLLHFRVHYHDRVQPGAVLVVCIDALQLKAHQFPAAQAPALHSIVHLRDSSLHHIKCRWLLCLQQQCSG